MATSEINIENILLILHARMHMILGVFLVAILIAMAITHQTPKMYRATTSINFDFMATNPVDDRGGGYASAQESYITTQIEILESRNVAQQVVDGLSDYERGRLIAALDAKTSDIERFSAKIKQFIKSVTSPSGSSDHPRQDGDNTKNSETLRVSSPYDWLARSIGADLEINQAFNSRVVEVSYYSTAPKIAALMANRFAEAYINTNLKMVIDPARKSKLWFDEQLKSVRARLEEAQAKLTAYQQKEAIVFSDEHIDIEASHLQNLINQLVAAQQATREAETKKEKLKEVLDSGASLMTFEPVFSNTLVQKIKAEIRDLEGRLVESSNSLGSNHPRIKKLKSELSAARNRLNSEVKTITDGVNNAADLSREREHDLHQAIDKQKKLVLKLKTEHNRVAVLKREVESANLTYNAALDQLNTTSMQSMVDQTIVSIIDHANIPSYHAKPNMKKNLAIGAFGGLLLGVGLAIFLAVFVRRVHSKQDLVGELGVPLLGHLKKV